MTSRSLPAITLATAALLSLATTVFGQTAEATPAERLLATLKERYPATAFTRVQNTPVPGLYEVVFGNNIAYAADDGRHFLFGHLFDLQTQRDLTAANAPPTTPPSAATPVAFAALPLADAIKTVRGDGRRVLAVFSDPDCPYCHELEVQLAALDDATVYTFLLPLAALHPQATAKPSPSGAPPIVPAPGARSCSRANHRRRRPVRTRSSAIARWRRSWRCAAPRP